ncbi:MAG: hypothetical protein GY822_20995 [Deltaproteobacteria bacterium]|nr:hypothetical protein [Deltaproteobacteria bacterium]
MPRIGGNRPSIPLSQLRGTEIPQDDNKVVSTASHTIQLSHEAGGMRLPDFKLTRRDIQDPSAKSKITDVSPQDLAAVKTGEDFKALLDTLLLDNKDFLKPNKADLKASLPEGDRSDFAFINIVGRRNEQFFDEVAGLIVKTGLRGADAKSARKEVNFAHRDAFAGNTVNFDRADTSTYWSYGHDAAFVHVFEKMLDSLPEGDSKRGPIQAQLDYVFTHKFVPNGTVNENDCASSLELMPIDKESRRPVSMTKKSEASNDVKYEMLKVPDDAGGEDAGKNVYREGKKFFFEGTRTEVPAALAAKLESTPVANYQDIVFRRPEGGERPVSGFRFNWNNNRMIENKLVDTGWWGHCDIKATIETILADMKGSAGVSEYRSDTDATTNFSRADQLEALAALLNMGASYYVVGNNSMTQLGSTEFAGGRFDDRPSKMGIKTASGKLDFQVRLSRVSESGDATKNVGLDDAFCKKTIGSDGMSFTDNPDLIRTEGGDVNFIDASKRKISGTSDGFTFNARGQPVEDKVSFVYDPMNPGDEKILIGSNLKDVNSHEITRYYLDPKTKKVTEVPTKFVETNGRYLPEEGAAKNLGKMTGMELGREMKAGDDVTGKMHMLEEAVKSGDKIATDSDTGMQVWNGEVHNIRLDVTRSPDGRFERTDIMVDATFGAGKAGTILREFDDSGNVVAVAEKSAAVDFFWKDRPRITPLTRQGNNWVVNRSMYDRGILTLGNDMDTSLAAITDLTDLIYLGLKAKGKNEMFTIAHEGKRLVYDNKSDWEADVQTLKGTGQGGGGVTHQKPDAALVKSLLARLPSPKRSLDKIPAGAGEADLQKLLADNQDRILSGSNPMIAGSEAAWLVKLAAHKNAGPALWTDLQNLVSSSKLSSVSKRVELDQFVAGLDVSGATGGGTGGQTSGPIAMAATPNLSIPDNDPEGAADVLSISRSGKLKDISVELDLKHTYVGDLNVALEAPDGTTVTLHKRGGSSRDDIAGTYGTNGDLSAYDDLEDLKGLEVNGDWTLKIVDMAGQDVGKLVSWGLNIDVE